MLHVVLDLQAGGLERLVGHLVQRVDGDRFQSGVLSIGDPGRYAEGLGADRVRVAEGMSRWSMLWPGRLAREIRRFAPDVVHTHSGVWYKASLAARLAGVARVVHTDHGRLHPEPWQVRLLDRLAARRTDVVVAVSERLAGDLAAGIVGDARRIRVIVNGVDTDAFCPRPDNGVIRRELGIAPDAPVVGSIGRFDPIKGYDVMLRAWALLCRRREPGPEPVLVIAGEGPEGGALARLVHDLGIEATVRLLAWRSDVADLHAAFTVFTLASHSEGTSLSLLEAMSAGICPVVTEVGGNRAVVGSGLSHRVVPPADPESLATAWIDALRDVARRQRDAQLARGRVQAGFGIAAMVRSYERLYAGDGVST